jgi:uncharacterized protein YdiU (UPF0061 family)
MDIGGRGGKPRDRHRKLRQIDGQHPFRDAVPDGFVDYPARIRPAGEVFYFNFPLAKEMGLLPARAPHEVDRALAEALLETFGLEIFNEYDQLHGTPVSPGQMRPFPYMATRYLQMQHPNKRGLTSGDGRSIWNGIVRGRNGAWDITSCGTGATRLSPACAIEQRFFRTGDKRVSYGCGRAELVDGVSAAVLSEIFHQSGIPTERTLAVIDYGDGTAITVRAGRNLLRPAHFFRYIKQGDRASLQRAIDYHIDRQVANGEWVAVRGRRARYRYLLDRVADDFARAAALFESEYIFCWMEWDGDNILSDGGIIDYGSVRQFGLYHHEYRYDDVDRLSTTITEQKRKARYIVQTFAQIVDFVQSGQKTNIRHFASHPAVRRFERSFLAALDERMAYRLGLPPVALQAVLSDRAAKTCLRTLGGLCRYFERVKSSRGLYEISDGVMWDAVFCLRDLLRELPHRYLKTEAPLEAAEFLSILRSRYATAADLSLGRGRRAKIRDFQYHYLALLERTAHLVGWSRRRLLQQVATRSGVINRHDRVTGDAVIWIAKRLARQAKALGSADRQRLIEQFIASQVLRPEFARYRAMEAALLDPAAQEILETLLRIVREHRDGI